MIEFPPMTNPLRPLLLLGLLVGPGCAQPLPPPREPRPADEEPAAQPAQPAKAAKPARTARAPLQVSETKAGLRVRDPATGLTFLAPGPGRVLEAGRRGDLAFDAGFRLDAAPFEVRLRLTHVSRPGQARKVALHLCRAVAAARSEREDVRVDAGSPKQCRAWGAQAAASAVYACRQEDLDMEETLVLVKGNEALVVWKAFDSRKVSPALWTELNTRLNASLRWGGAPRSPTSTPSVYVDRQARLLDAALARAKRLAATLHEAKVSRAEVSRAAAKVREVAFGSDPPDAKLGDRSIVREAIEAGASAALRKALGQELSQRVVTYRDLRGLSLLLDEVARVYPEPR